MVTFNSQLQVSDLAFTMRLPSLRYLAILTVMILCPLGLSFFVFANCTSPLSKRAVVFRNADRMNILPSFFKRSNFTEMVSAGLTSAQGEAEIFEKGVQLKKQLGEFAKRLDPSRDVIVSSTAPDRSLKSAIVLFTGMFHYPNISKNEAPQSYRFAEVSTPVAIISRVSTIPAYSILLQACANFEQQLIAANDSLYSNAKSYINQLYAMDILDDSAVDHPFDLTEAEFIIAEIVATKGRPNSKTELPSELNQQLSDHIHEYEMRLIDEVARIYGGRDVVCSSLRDAILYFLESRFSFAIFSIQDYMMYVVRLCYGHLDTYPLPGRGYLFTISSADNVDVEIF